jgi:small GTP-binding protein
MRYVILSTAHGILMKKNVEKKVCLLGDFGVGKTSLIRRFVYDAYDDRYLSTLGVKVTKKQMVIKDFKKKPFFKVDLTLLIWDLVGQKGFQSLKASAYKGTNGALIVCDLSRPETIDSMEWWVDSLQKVQKDIPLIFLANKVDLTDNAVPPELRGKIDSIINKYNGLFFSTSAKTGQDVEVAFQNMGNMLTTKFFE